MEVADLLEKETPSRAAQEEILSLGILRDELQSSLDLEKTRVKSLEEAIVREKSDSFKEGCSKGVEEFLASDDFQQKKREAVEEFLRSEEYHRSIASLIASFKASQEYKTRSLRTSRNSSPRRPSRSWFPKGSRTIRTLPNSRSFNSTS